ncbi:MAG: hypothetical protein WD231_03785 [Candidatus Woykebacteria bacterium]
MQGSPEIPKFESQPENITVKEKTGSVQEHIGRDRKQEQLRESGEKQRREDKERIAEIRVDLSRSVAERETHQSTSAQGSNQLNPREEHESRMNYLGLKKSNSYTIDEIKDMQSVVISNLQETFPGYNINERLDGAEDTTFIANRDSFNEFALKQRFHVMNERLVSILKTLPLPVAGWAFGSFETVINGGLPRFLVKRTMYHEDLHLASAGAMDTPINEGATEYYARQAASQEGFIYNIMNPFYLPRALAYGVMARVVGPNIADGAYFDGRVAEFREALDAKWGIDAFDKVNEKSFGRFGFGAFFYTVFKRLTIR